MMKGCCFTGVVCQICAEAHDESCRTMEQVFVRIPGTRQYYWHGVWTCHTCLWTSGLVEDQKYPGPGYMLMTRRFLDWEEQRLRLELQQVDRALKELNELVGAQDLDSAADGAQHDDDDK